MFKTINPKKSKEVEIKGAKILIGSIPYQKFLEFRAQLSSFSRADIKDTKENALILYNAHIDFCKWGVKGHDDIVFEDGTPVPFKTSKIKFDDKEFEVVSDETIQTYIPDSLYVEIAGQVLNYNMLTGAEEKN